MQKEAVLCLESEEIESGLSAEFNVGPLAPSVIDCNRIIPRLDLEALARRIILQLHLDKEMED
jgi:hypothetical protein